MFRMSLVILAGLSALQAGFSHVGAQDLPRLEFEKFVLANGLEVILHEDHAIPVVAVNVWYHVGSKNEKPGRTGFAHLFEHMMFQGSEHHDTDYFLPLYNVGAQVNASTTEDRTNYWENLPSDQLELALWLEADRMGYLLPAMTQERLDNQRDVVKNEKREGENYPYAKARELTTRLLFPNEHPYAHTVIGSMEDLSAASLEDVSEFFRLYYAPNNASLCIAGDFDPVFAKELVEKYFAAIPAGRPVERLESWIPPLDGIRRAVAEDNVELARVYYKWPTPALFQPGDAELDILSNILTAGKTSRLYKRLVYEMQVAQDVAAYQASHEICGVYTVQVTAREGQDLTELEGVIDAELRRLMEDGVSREELDLAQTAIETDFVRRLQRVGAFYGKADLLNSYNVMAGDPGYIDEDLARYRNATREGVCDVARRYLDLERRLILHVVPQGTLVASDVAIDRGVQPEGSGEAAFVPPPIQTATLSNGLKLYLVEKHGLPLVQIDLYIKSGWAADPTGRLGTAALTAALLDEGTRSRDALEITTAAARLGADLHTGSTFNRSYVTLNVLKRHLDGGLDLVRDLVLNPAFPEEEFERQRQIYLGRVQQESVQPEAAALKAFQRRLYGKEHPYAQPVSGSGTKASLTVLEPGDLVAFHRDYYLPNNAAVVVVGDVTLREAQEKLDKAFGEWKGKPVIDREIPEPNPETTARVCIIDRPGAEQSVIIAGHPCISRAHPDYVAFEVMNNVLGGHFGARINMNLREEKGYTYGAYTTLRSMGEDGLFYSTAPVHSEYTKEAVQEILKEIEGIKEGRPASEEELVNSRNRLALGFPQQFETYDGIAYRVGVIYSYDLPPDEWQQYMNRVRQTRRSDVERIIRDHLHPDALIFVVLGDREKIEPGIRELGLGELVIMDAADL